MAKMKDLLVDLPDAYMTVRKVLTVQWESAMAQDDLWQAADYRTALEALDDCMGELLAVSF